MKKYGYLIGLSILITVLVFPLAALAQNSGAIAFDQVVSGEITNDRYEIPYQFQGLAGEHVVIRMTATSENPRLDSYLRLIGPNGDELAFDDDSGGNLNSLIGPYRLPEDGSYTIIATRFQQANGSSMGTFELVVTQPQINALFLNEQLTLELNESNSLQFFNYTSSDGGIYDMRVDAVSGTGGANISVEDMDGNFINSLWVAANNPTTTFPIRLDAGETVTFTMRREPDYSGPTPNSSGSIRFDFTLIEVEASAFPFNTAVSGTLDDGNPVNYYSFDGSVGDIIRLVGTRTSGDFELTVLNPLGQPFNGGATPYMNGEVVLDPLTLDSTGQYIIVVRRIGQNGPGDVSGMITTYDLSLSMTETPELQNGVEATGMVDPDSNRYEQVFRYNGSAGQTIRITVRSLDGSYAPAFDMNATMEVDSNTGQVSVPGPRGMGGPPQFYLTFSSTEPGVLTYEVTLPVTSVYLVRVRSGSYSPEGPVGGSFGVLIELVG